MRTAELLAALSKAKPGLLCLVGPDRSVVETLYGPRVRISSPTLFDAALSVACELFAHRDCPPDVKTALEAYEDHTGKLAP